MKPIIADKFIHNCDTFFKKHTILSALILASGVSYLDGKAGYEVSLATVYLIPISFASWFGGKKSGYIIAIVCSILRLVTQYFYPHSSVSVVVYSVAIRLCLFLFIAYVISKLKLSLEKETGLARSDSMTGAANQRYFNELCNAEISRLARYHHPFSVGYLDIDDFKKINDVFGHSAGNTLLITVTDTIKKQLRATDSISRLGGDEFVVLLSETDEDSARIVFTRIRNALHMAVKELPITFSIGVITFIKVPDSTDHILRAVDRLMYSVKNQGKNGIAYSVYKELPKD